MQLAFVDALQAHLLLALSWGFGRTSVLGNSNYEEKQASRARVRPKSQGCSPECSPD